MLLQRNANKFEYWFMVWVIVKNRYIGEVDVE